MKIRLIGSPDLIRAWAAELKKAYGVTGREYPCRGSSDVRLYIDLDDRQATALVNLGNDSQGRAGQTMTKKR